MLAAVPGALVFRFFLTPHNVFDIVKTLNRVQQVVIWKRIKLFYSDDGDMIQLMLTPCSSKLVIHLAATHHQPGHL